MGQKLIILVNKNTAATIIKTMESTPLITWVKNNTPIIMAIRMRKIRSKEDMFGFIILYNLMQRTEGQTTRLGTNVTLIRKNKTATTILYYCAPVLLFLFVPWCVASGLWPRGGCAILRLFVGG